MVSALWIASLENPLVNVSGKTIKSQPRSAAIMLA